jgi:hypothetical protein
MADILWHYAKGHEQLGPVNSAELKQMAADGWLLPEDLVWREGMAQWAAAGQVRGLFPDRGSGPDLSIRESARAGDEAPKSFEPRTAASSAASPGGPALTIYWLQAALWACCLVVVLVAGAVLLMTLWRADSAQDRAGAGAVFLSFVVGAYVLARAGEKLTELVLSYLDAQRRRGAGRSDV